MKGLSLACAVSAALVGVSFGGPVQAQERFVTIGTGGQTGVYYVAGQSICRFLNRGAADHQIKCNAPASGGGVANVNGIRSGEFVEILDGLADGAEYVAMGQNKLTDGAAIERVAAAE